MIEPDLIGGHERRCDPRNPRLLREIGDLGNLGPATEVLGEPARVPGCAGNLSEAARFVQDAADPLDGLLDLLRIEDAPYAYDAVPGIGTGEVRIERRHAHATRVATLR